MKAEILRTKCLALMRCGALEDCLNTIGIFENFLYQLMKRHDIDQTHSDVDSDSKIFAQLLFSKLIHLRRLLNHNEHNSEFRHVASIIDPSIISAVVRNVFETAATFNLIYRDKSEDEKKLIYNLWAIAGLNYRQRFATPDLDTENIAKLNNENASINDRIDKIKNGMVFRNLSARGQGKILDSIKKKDFRIRVEGDNIKVLSWQDLFKEMHLTGSYFENMYTLLSLNSHPSYVSLFQFRQMFVKGKDEFLDLTLIDLRFSFIFYSVFVADFIAMFPGAKEDFEALPLVHQIIMNFRNKLFRGDNYSINDSWKNLND